MIDKHEVGESDIESIRIAGMKLENLDMVPAAHAKQQMPKVLKTDKQNKIDAIKAKYPKQSALYLRSRITECEENVQRIMKFITDMNAKIAEYRGQIVMCEMRDKQMETLDPDNDRDKEIIKDLKFRFPPYNVPAMEQQILQFQEAIDRSEAVIKQEYASIGEHKEIVSLCDQRDLELKQYGE